MKRWGAVFLALFSGVVLAWEGQNTYGPGQHADRYGRPFEFQTDDGQAVPGGVKVQPNGYGPGVGIDEYGRPVRAVDPATGRALEPFSIDDAPD
ncbi:hypothetical protein [Immundisolibacter sp.]|jgi:hypothetical protein|uniref:hypothetical protein n=1 Tax=Immundisolibacter sp. TaxID=1934948 RepID=UPI002635BC25|nr:hypothetical protein [Immundisolibacter sp.]MDD3651192.1 hypothetical protein [Immundisolibacter sp.]